MDEDLPYELSWGSKASKTDPLGSVRIGVTWSEGGEILRYKGNF